MRSLHHLVPLGTLCSALSIAFFFFLIHASFNLSYILLQDKTQHIHLSGIGVVFLVCDSYLRETYFFARKGTNIGIERSECKHVTEPCKFECLFFFLFFSLILLSMNHNRLVILTSNHFVNCNTVFLQRTLPTSSPLPPLKAS